MRIDGGFGLLPIFGPLSLLALISLPYGLEKDVGVTEVKFSLNYGIV